MRLRYRMAMVHMKMRVKNAVHGVLVRCNVHLPHSDIFGKRGREVLRRCPIEVGPGSMRPPGTGPRRRLSFADGLAVR